MPRAASASAQPPALSALHTPSSRADHRDAPDLDANPATSDTLVRVLGSIPMHQPQFVLKTTPPRLPRTAVLQRALVRRWDDLHERTAILVEAPRGFGKTTLLSQWRRAWLERGAFVAWLTLDARDTPGRFAEALLASLHVATGSRQSRLGRRIDRRVGA